jgi:hypothetical protein
VRHPRLALAGSGGVQQGFAHPSIQAKKLACIFLYSLTCMYSLLRTLMWQSKPSQCQWDDALPGTVVRGSSA